MGIVFTKVERPTVTRSRKANPYLDEVKSLAADMTTTLAVTDLPYNTDEDVKAVNGFISQVQAAGRELDVSVRKMVETSESGTGKNKTTTATVTFWAVEAIKRPRGLE